MLKAARGGSNSSVMHDGSTGFCVCSACSDSANGNNSLQILQLRFLSLFGNLVHIRNKFCSV